MAQQLSITQLMTMFLLVTAVVTGGFFLIAESNPEEASLDEYSGMSQHFNTTVDNVNSIKDDTFLGKISSFASLGLDAINSLLTISTDIIGQVETSVNAFVGDNGIVKTLAVNLHMPYWVTSLIGALIALGVGMAIIAVWRRWNP